MAYATDPLFCMAYPLEFIDKKDPGMMTFRNLDNHLLHSWGVARWSICQLLVQDCLEHEYERTSHNGCLIIPRGVQFGKELFPEIVMSEEPCCTIP